MFVLVYAALHRRDSIWCMWTNHIIIHGPGMSSGLSCSRNHGHRRRRYRSINRTHSWFRSRTRSRNHCMNIRECLTMIGFRNPNVSPRGRQCTRNRNVIRVFMCNALSLLC